MSRRPSLLRTLTGWRRQLALGVLLVLQAAITLSPLLETNEQGRLRSHVEEQGAQHKYQHDDSTCAVCAVRSLHSSPAQSCPAIECDRSQSVAALDVPVSIAFRSDPTALPRAPPTPR